MVREPNFDPRVSIVLAHDRLVEHRVVVTGRIAGGEPRRDAQAAEHQYLGGRELLAVPLLDVEQEPVDRVSPGGHVAELLRVLEVLLQVARERHHQVELVRAVIARDPHRECLRADRQRRVIEVGWVLVRRVEDIRVLAQLIRAQVGQVGHDRIRLAGSKQVWSSERPVCVFAQR